MDFVIPDPVHWEDLAGSGGEGGGRGHQDGETHVNPWLFHFISSLIYLIEP